MLGFIFVYFIQTPVFAAPYPNVLRDKNLANIMSRMPAAKPDIIERESEAEMKAKMILNLLAERGVEQGNPECPRYCTECDRKPNPIIVSCLKCFYCWITGDS